MTRVLGGLAISIAVMAGAMTTALAAPGIYSPADRESIEWCDVWISHANETNLPRVLLIGDSIARDYYPQVEKRLAGKAYVGRMCSSAFIADPVLLNQIRTTLESTKFDIIHFNNGMHGWQHSEAEYESAFPEYLATIRKYAPNAKLIWASTTPLKESPDGALESSSKATDARIMARNAIALKLVESSDKIPVDDLYSLMKGHPEFHRDNVHFNTQGKTLQAAQVASQVEKLLPTR